MYLCIDKYKRTCMSISLEKEEIIRQFNLVHDINVIRAIKSLLELGLQRQDSEGEEEDKEALQASIQRGLHELENGMGIPHEQVMADLRKRYKL